MTITTDPTLTPTDRISVTVGRSAPVTQVVTATADQPAIEELATRRYGTVVLRQCVQQARNTTQHQTGKVTEALCGLASAMAAEECLLREQDPSQRPFTAEVFQVRLQVATSSRLLELAQSYLAKEQHRWETYTEDTSGHCQVQYLVGTTEDKAICKSAGDRSVLVWIRQMSTDRSVW